jgi:hypothetical protein
MYLNCVTTAGPCNGDVVFSVTHQINFFFGAFEKLRKAITSRNINIKHIYTTINTYT